MASPVPLARTRAIRQIAALPYRFEGTGSDAGLRVLLVTSRATKRWVVPKGNIAPGLSPAASAAAEAEEEAGVCGALCPVPLGAYRYRKKRGSGASLMVDVDVFPLAVTQEMADWKERDQRERRWFSLAAAADAVDETDLRDLIRSFAPAQFRAAVRQARRSPDSQGRKASRMFSWFQRLLPRTGNFFEMFEAHAATVLAGAEATARLLDGGANAAEHIREIGEREHDADDITRDVLKQVRATFLTPFDRGAITALIGALDDTIDEMQSAASAIDLFEVGSFAPEMRDMAALAVDAARLTAEAMPLLRDVTRNGDRLHELTERIIRIEGHADEVHKAGLKRSLKEFGDIDTLRFVKERELYEHLERIVDAFEDVADEIDGIVIDYA